MRPARAILLAIVLASVVPYLPTLDNYFIQDDFGVVGLLSSKPASYFPKWFTMPWTEDIWGYVPDEVRPFPALSYQIAGQFGAASPVANHVINIAFHAVNALLVWGIAQSAAGLAGWPAAFAALVFALLPMQTESVAWVTGRVDSMPACFYLASFLLYARWRTTSRRVTYVWSLVAFFVALFTKQNTVTLLPALMAYDLVVLRRPIRVSWAWLRPYVAFGVMTVGFLGLRYVLFGEVARESMLTSERFYWFGVDLSTHLRRMVFGEPGLKIAGWRAMAYVAAAGAAISALAVTIGERRTPGRAAPVLYFLVVWITLAIAPTVVAGYASPRHMYLASAGWAIALAFALDVLWNARPVAIVRRIGMGLAAALLVAYGLQLWHEVRLWDVRAAVSQKAVQDLEREAKAAPPGTLIIAGAPRRSWDFALPHAIRPPFTSWDVTSRVRVISHSSIHCCPANVWEPYTRDTLRAWASDPARPPVVALHWDADTGRLSRRSDVEDPFLRPLVTMLLDTKEVASLDRVILDVTNRYTAGRQP